MALCDGSRNMSPTGLRLICKWVRDLPNPKMGKRENAKVNGSCGMMDVSAGGMNRIQ